MVKLQSTTSGKQLKTDLSVVPSYSVTDQQIKDYIIQGYLQGKEHLESSLIATAQKYRPLSKSSIAEKPLGFILRQIF